MSKIDVCRNYFNKVCITIDQESAQNLISIYDNSFKEVQFEAGTLSYINKSSQINRNAVISQYNSVSQYFGKDLSSIPDDFIKSNSISANEFGYYGNNMIVFNYNNALRFLGILYAGNNRPEKVKKGFSMLDTTLNKPIWWTGTKWVDAIGADV